MAPPERVLDAETRQSISELPAATTHQVRDLAEEMIERLLVRTHATMAANGRSTSGSSTRGIEIGVNATVEQFVQLLLDPTSDLARARTIFRQLGRGQYLEGHGGDALRSVVIDATREMWAVLVDHRDDFSPEHLYVLSGLLFPFAESLASAAAEGHAEEEAQNRFDWAMSKRRLVTMLLRAEPASEVALRVAADEARWPLPQRVAVVVVEERNAEGLAREAGLGAIGAVVDDTTQIIVPDPDLPGRVPHLRRALARRSAALGATVPLADARRSHRQADRALRLMRSGALPGDGLLVCEDHLLDLIWMWEPGLAAGFADEVLTPLDDLGTKQERVLSDTLFAWLAHQGRVPDVAAALHAHPQTVRYRMRTLRQLLGDRLDDPLTRFRLEAALRYRLGASDDQPRDD